MYIIVQMWYTGGYRIDLLNKNKMPWSPLKVTRALIHWKGHVATHDNPLSGYN